jgi:hypothetical protein
MLSSTLLNILSKFSAREIKEFGEFVNSPFFNKNENVIKLYNYIKKFHPEFNDKKLEKQYIYKRIFSKGKYNDGFMRTVIYNLGKLTEDFLAYVNFSKDEMDRGINLLKELNERKLEKVFLKYYSEIEGEIDKTEYHGHDYFYKKFQLQNEMEIYMDWSKFKHKDFKSYTKNISSFINDELTSFYLIRALNHYRFVLDRSTYEHMEVNYEFIDHIMSYLLTRDNHFRNKIKIKLHMYEILLLKEKKQEYYDILKEILINEKNSLNHSDKYSLHNILQSFCIHEGFSGKTGFSNERFELYKICLEQKLYAASEHIYFDDIMFGNIAITAISLKEFDWTEDFINKYKESLSPENRDVVINYSYARLNFVKGKFEEALKYLNSIKAIKHIQFKMPIRNLMLMVYYELSNLNQASYQIDSYRHFLVNNKSSLSDIRFERVSNFLKFFTRLAKIKEKNNMSELKKLKSDMELTNNVTEKPWLTEKIKEYI